MIATENKLTNMQLELLKMFKYNLPEFQIIELKELLSNYFSTKIDSEIEKLFVDKKWSESDIDNIVNQHTRTSYK